MTFPQTQDSAEKRIGNTVLLQSLRDEQRSARRWQDLLSTADRRTMLAQIARVALAIGQDLYPAHDLGDLDIGTLSHRGEVCPRERLAFLAAVWPRLSNALRIIEAAPAAALTPGLREARVEHGSLKRVSPTAVLAAVRTGDLFPAPFSASPLARRLAGRLPRHISETIAVLTFDTAVNRAVKAILVQVARDLGFIAVLALESESPEVARQAEILRETVRRRLRREPWQHLPLVPVQSAYPPAFGPSYRYVFEQWRRYRRAFAFDWTNPVFTLPPRETWLLYEYSCLFTVAEALRALGFRTSSADNFAVSRSGLTFLLEKGRPSRLVFQRGEGPKLILSYNPRFPRTEPGPVTGWHSRSQSLRPDITLEINGSLLILDAKFKTYAEPSLNEEAPTLWQFREGALLPDLQQMHTYRDAIVHGARDNTVAEAWLLYPGRLTVENPEIVSYPPPTLAHPFGTGRVGAILVRPGAEPKPLQHFLNWFLARQTRESGEAGTNVPR